MHCNMKELMGESPAHIPKGLLDSVKVSSVYLECWHWLCARCVQQVCGSAEKALSQPQGCVCADAWGHSAATQSQDSSPASCWMKGSLCSQARPGSPPFLCARPIPPVPSFPSPSPQDWGRVPHGYLVALVSMRTSSPFNPISLQWYSFGLYFKSPSFCPTPIIVEM